MRKVLMDVSSLVNQYRKSSIPHGIRRVTHAYLEHYADRIQVVIRLFHRVFVLPEDSSKEIVTLFLNWQDSDFKKLMRLVAKGVLRSRFTKINPDTFLLKTDHSGCKDLRYYESLKRLRIKTVVVIHDIIPLVYPEYSLAKGFIKFKDSINNILEHSSGLIAVSDTTKTELSHYVQSTGKSVPPLITSKLAPGLILNDTTNKPLIEGCYFIVIGTMGSRKNYLFLLQIWRELVMTLGSKCPKLLIIGKRLGQCSTTLSMLDRCEQLQGVVIQSLDRDDLLAHYIRHARALLFPSFAEGYGLPLIEALSANIPVIASNLPVFQEIGGSIPEYLHPLDGLGWMQCILDYTQEDSLRRSHQLQRMQQFSPPSWADHFTRVDAFLDEMASDHAI